MSDATKAHCERPAKPPMSATVPDTGVSLAEQLEAVADAHGHIVRGTFVGPNVPQYLRAAIETLKWVESRIWRDRPYDDRVLMRGECFWCGFENRPATHPDDHCEPTPTDTDPSGALIPREVQIGDTLFLAFEHGCYRLRRDFCPDEFGGRRSISLTPAQMEALIAAVNGWRKLPPGYSEESIDFPTPGHIIPETNIQDKPHTLSASCDCFPVYERVEGQFVIRHRRVPKGLK